MLIYIYLGRNNDKLSKYKSLIIYYLTLSDNEHYNCKHNTKFSPKHNRTKVMYISNNNQERSSIANNIAINIFRYYE